ncbi:MAG TPA: NTP transferase domain-containing protein [Anaerolineae bacterium]|nr:NTP transferase domain-containing protein [Anaerolineae bacterium]
MQAVILAAGSGKRLGLLTQYRSKAMQPIVGKPMVERVIESFYLHDIHEFIIVIRPNDKSIRPHLEKNTSYDIKFTFVFQDQQLGMAHALKQASQVINNNFILSACDNLIPLDDLNRFLTTWRNNKQYNGLLTLISLPDEMIPKSGIVELNGDNSIKRIVEKPSLDKAPSNIGSIPIYGFSKRILGYLDKIDISPRNEFELQDAIQMMIEDEGGVYGYHVSERYTVTSPQDLLNVNRAYLRRNNELNILFDKELINLSTQFIPPIHIEPNVKIGKNCFIGPEVFIEKGCEIKDNVSIQSSVILSGTKVEENTIIKEKVLCPFCD